MDEPQLIFYFGNYKKAELVSRDSTLSPSKREDFLHFITLGETVGDLGDLLPILPTFNFGPFIVTFDDKDKPIQGKIYNIYKLLVDKMDSMARLRKADFYTIDNTVSYSYPKDENALAIFPTGQLLMGKKSKQ